MIRGLFFARLRSAADLYQPMWAALPHQAYALIHFILIYI